MQGAALAQQQGRGEGADPALLVNVLPYEALVAAGQVGSRDRCGVPGMSQGTGFHAVG